MNKKMIVYSIQENICYTEGEDTYVIMRYSSMDEAKKYMVALYTQKMSDPECENVSFDNSEYVLNYSLKLFKYGNTCTCEIIEEEIEIKDKFDPMDV